MSADGFELLRQLYRQLGKLLGAASEGEAKAPEGDAAREPQVEEKPCEKRPRGSRFSRACAEDVYRVLTAVGRRLSATQVASELSLRGTPWCSSTLAATLAELRRRGELTNASDDYGVGYGLPIWDSRRAG